MDKIEIKSVAIFALTIAFGVLAYNFFTFKEKCKEDLVRIEAINVAVLKQNNQLSGQFDSLQNTTKILAKSFLYIDSCNSNRVSKTERAERRGRFLGGILKGLMPGL
jgi:hypothetical protein